MRLRSFRIENFRNLRLAQCDNVPDFAVICGGNGCGKSALLEALITAKEHAGAYGNFSFDPRAVSADADRATITMSIEFSKRDQDYITANYNYDCPPTDEIVVTVNKGGRARAEKRSDAARQLLGYYSRARGSPGFFDYIGAYRQPQKVQLTTWDATFLSDQRARQTLAASDPKFQYTKAYLAGLKMRDLQELQALMRSGGLSKASSPDSLKEIREFFDLFFSPMRFVDVSIDTSPFAYEIDTPSGVVDLDDLSSGEKEVLNIFIRFHQLRPEAAVILFDEADAHLHPDLQRRYLHMLRRLGEGNQLILTTHSPEMMIAAGTDALYTVLKQPPPDGGNQFVKVTDSDYLYEVLSDLMGSRGIISFNQRIVFIEGQESSADREIYEAFYPPAQYNVAFVPAGNSSTVRKTAEQVNALLASSVGFQQYFSIVDGDVSRVVPDPTQGTRLFTLPVYHVENLLLDAESIFSVTREMLGARCPYASASDVQRDLEHLLFCESHVNALARALLDRHLSEIAQQAYTDAYLGEPQTSHVRPAFAEMQDHAASMLTSALEEGTWCQVCKGRELLKAYCGKHGLTYRHFRNSLTVRLGSPPPELAQIMNRILST